jgi:hypothetical protein
MSPSLAISILALFVALGGTGYAAATISGADIVNDTVTSQDVKNRTLKGKDVGRDALRGAQIRESSLARVPLADSSRVADTAGLASRADTAGHAEAATSAATANHAATADDATTAERAGLLDGIDSLGFARVRSAASSDITETESLSLAVADYGRYEILCSDNDTPGVTDDDFVSFLWESFLPAGAVESVLIAAAEDDASDPQTRMISGVNGGGVTQPGVTGDRLSATFRSGVPGTEKAIVVEAGGHEDEAGADCHGQIQAFLLG